jgi:hypothetical protein
MHGTNIKPRSTVPHYALRERLQTSTEYINAVEPGYKDIGSRDISPTE